MFIVLLYLVPKETVHALYEYLYQTMQFQETLDDVFFKFIQFPIAYAKLVKTLNCRA